MKQISSFLLLSIILYSCSTLGTKTLYKSNSYRSIKDQKLGFLELRCDSVLLTIYSNTNNVFQHTVDSTLHLYDNFQITYLPRQFCFKPPTIEEIKEICQLNNIDMVFYTTLKFTRVQPYGYLDSSILMELYEKDGNLIMKTMHNTGLGNSYWKFPRPDMTIKDATFGALNRILAELNTVQTK